MKVVIDTNVVISMLIKPGKPIELFFNEKLDIFAPYFLLEEIENNRDIILEKSRLEPQDIDILLSLLKSKIVFIDANDFRNYLKPAESICPDKKDIIYFALALHLNCAIWSNDKKLKKQDCIKVFLTHEILAMFDLIDKI